MQPTEYLLVLAGMLPGAIVGFLTAAALATAKYGRIEINAWAAARRYYTHKQQEGERNS